MLNEGMEIYLEPTKENITNPSSLQKTKAKELQNRSKLITPPMIYGGGGEFGIEYHTLGIEILKKGGGNYFNTP